MANGIDPLTEKNIKEDDLLNNIRISRCLFYVNDILKEAILNNGYKFKKEPKIPFNLTKKQLKNYKFEEYDLRITEIIKKFNSLIENESMRKLTVTNVTKWLTSIGLLKEEIIDNTKRTKTPTENGLMMGIYTAKRFNAYNREYTAVL